MSTKPSNAGCGKVIGYVLLVGLALLLLRSVYYALCYVGLNTLLALDQSAYVHLAHSHWLGYALLGFGLGAAGGAIAAQRRYGLSRNITVGAWLAVAVLLGVAYAGAAEATDAAEETTATLPAEAAAGTEPEPAPQPELPAAPATLPLAYDYLQNHGQQVPARYDDFVAGMRQPGQLRQLYAYLRAQSLRVPDSYEEFAANMAVPEAAPIAAPTETEPATDDPEADEVPATQAAEDSALLDETVVPPARPLPQVALALPAHQKLRAPTPVRLATPAVVPPASASAATPAHPTGHQQYTGQVGNLRATYSLDWQPGGELSGSYYYNQQPAVIYRLSGAIGQGGELHLVEFTRGRQSARCVLQLQGAGFVGTMVNTDGRQFPMSLE